MRFLSALILHRIADRPNLVKVVENIGWLFLDNILRMGVGLFVGIWVARYLGPEQFGLINFATALVGIFGVIGGLGLSGIAVRDIVLNPAVKEETLGTVAMMHFLAGILAYALMLMTMSWLRTDTPLAKTLVTVLGFAMLFKASDVAIYWFESQVQSKYVVWVHNSALILFAAIKIGLILSQAPLVAFAWAALSEALVVAITLMIVLGMRGPKLHKLKGNLNHAKNLLKESWPLMLSGMAVMVYMKIDQIMLGQMIGDDAVGIYSAAVRVSEIWYFIPIAIVNSYFPTILAIKKIKPDRYDLGLQNIYDLMVWIPIAVALPMTFLATNVVTLLFGKDFEAAGNILAVNIWATIFIMLNFASGKHLISEGYQMLTLQRSLLGAIANIILNYFLIPYYGALGAAWATVFSYAIAGFMADSLSIKTRRMFYMKASAFNLVGATNRLRNILKSYNN